MTKRLVLVALVGIAVYAGVRLRGDRAQPADDRKLVVDRIWVDHLPQNPRDEISIFLALTEEQMGDAIGIFQTGSQWRAKYELFEHESGGEQLKIVYPQTGERESVRTRARACNDHGWDFCLELSGNSRGVKKYYSMEGWEVGSRSAADARIRSLYTH
jgi:hypothetical protein